jgi:hypothetical protein
VFNTHQLLVLTAFRASSGGPTPAAIPAHVRLNSSLARVSPLLATYTEPPHPAVALLASAPANGLDSDLPEASQDGGFPHARMKLEAC